MGSLPREAHGTSEPVREVWPDVLRAIAIYGVVFMHLPGTESDTNLFRFSVPVFIGLWAANYERALARRTAPDRRTYVRNRLIQLAITYVFWTAVSLMRYARDGWPIDAIGRDLRYGSMWAGQYFLVVLFQFTALYPLIRTQLPRRVIALLWSVGAIAGPLVGRFIGQWPLVGQWGDQPFWYWIPFVAAGAASARGELPRIPVWVALPVAFVSLSLAPAEYSPVTTPLTPMMVSVSVGSVALVIAASNRGGSLPGPVGAAVSYVGMNTFPIYVLNPLVIGFMLNMSVNWRFDVFPIRVVTAAGVLLTCLALGEIFRKAKLGVLVGK